MIDPGEYLMDPVGFNLPLGKNFLEAELRGAKKILLARYIRGLSIHVNCKSSKKSNNLVILWAGLIIFRENGLNITH